jgi:hypothetical protein
VHVTVIGKIRLCPIPRGSGETTFVTASPPSLSFKQLNVLVAVTVVVPLVMMTVGAGGGAKDVDQIGVMPGGQIFAVGVASLTVQLVPTGILLIVCDPPLLRGNVVPPQLTVNWKVNPVGSATAA